MNQSVLLAMGIWRFRRFGRCWLLISDSVSFFLLHLNSLASIKAANEEKEEAERGDIFLISTLFCLGFRTATL